jgi:hypothetical protein
MSFHFKHWVFFIMMVVLFTVYLIYRAISGNNHRTISNGKINNKENLVYWTTAALNNPTYNHSRLKRRGGKKKKKTSALSRIH